MTTDNAAPRGIEGEKPKGCRESDAGERAKDGNSESARSLPECPAGAAPDTLPEGLRIRYADDSIPCVDKDDYDALCTSALACKEEVKRLRSEVREWVCVNCNTVYPGPPQRGLYCVICPKCNGSTAPRNSRAEVTLLRDRADQLQRENELLAAAVRDANRIGQLNDGSQSHYTLKQWLEQHAPAIEIAKKKG